MIHMDQMVPIGVVCNCHTLVEGTANPSSDSFHDRIDRFSYIRPICPRDAPWNKAPRKDTLTKTPWLSGDFDSNSVSARHAAPLRLCVTLNVCRCDCCLCFHSRCAARHRGVLPVHLAANTWRLTGSNTECLCDCQSSWAGNSNLQPCLNTPLCNHLCQQDTCRSCSDLFIVTDNIHSDNILCLIPCGTPVFLIK